MNNLVSNKKFMALSLEQRRVAVAFDVLAQLKDQQISPRGGAGIFKPTEHKCYVCAIGASVCALRTSERTTSLKSMVQKYLGDVFGHVLEATFEGWAESFLENAYCIYRNPYALQHLMINIINNDGQLDLTQSTTDIVDPSKRNPLTAEVDTLTVEV